MVMRKVIKHWVSLVRRHNRNRKIWAEYKNRLRKITDDGQELDRIILIADALQRSTHKAQYVLQDHDGVLRSLNGAQIRALKKFKVMDKKVTVYDLLTESLYSTMNNHFVVLFKDSHWEFFRGTILECIAKYEEYVGCTEIQILGNFERVVTIKDGKVIKH